jgi:hypothetical protein
MWEVQRWTCPRRRLVTRGEEAIQRQGPICPSIERAGRLGAAMPMGWQRRRQEPPWPCVGHTAVMATTAIREEGEGALPPKVAVRAGLAAS